MISRRYQWCVYTLAAMMGVGCTPLDLSELGENTPEATPTNAPDEDNDGFVAENDCDDNNAAINPDAQEICDGADNDCDGRTDVADGLVHYTDADHDGYGTGDSVEGCPPDTNFSAVAGDCNDADTAINPGVLEACNGIDDDCNASTDELIDSDADGYTVCQRDCNDTSNSVHPFLVDDDGASIPLDEVYATSIQAAIDSPDNCRTIFVHPGTYSASHILSNVDDFVIIGVEGPAVTLLTDNDAKPVLTIENSSRVVISGLGFTAEYPVDAFGGGIRLVDSSDVEFSDLLFTGLSVSGSSSFGGGIGITGSTNVLIEDSTFIGNEAAQAAAIGVDSSDVTVRSSIFEDNYGSFAGGAVGAGDVYEGGEGPGLMNVEECYFFNNTAYYWAGAAIAENGSVLNIDRSYFEGNQTTADSIAEVGSGGGAVYNAVRVTESYFIANAAFTYAGALMVSDPSVVENNFFWHNRGYISGGAMNVYSSLSGQKPKNHVVQFNSFIDNISPLGASLYYYDGDLLTLQGNIFNNANTTNTSFCNAEVIGDLSLEYNIFNNKESRPSDTGCFEDSELDYSRGSNLFANPLFVGYINDTTTSFFAQDFHLQPTSPAVQAAALGSNGEMYDMGAFGGPAPIEWVPDLDIIQ